MTRLRCFAVTALPGLAVASHPAQAETFRCGQWIASPDMTVEELLGKCGEPTTKTVEVVDGRIRSMERGR